MELPSNWQGATPVSDILSVEFQLLMFDRVRTLLVSNALPPTPPIYELLWRYLTVNDHALAYAVDLAISRRALDATKATALHRKHCTTSARDRDRPAATALQPG